MTTKHDYIIGIDPDCDKSGVAAIGTKDRNIECTCMNFPAVLTYLQFLSEVIGKDENTSVIVIVEAGWLNKTHFHVNSSDSRRVSAAKGNSVGRNHETGRKIVEMAKHYGLEVLEQRPLRKGWKGPGGKITHEELAYFVPGLPARTNQEMRDAALIVVNYAGWPIKIKPKGK
jgi:hypothetical protein